MNEGINNENLIEKTIKAIENEVSVMGGNDYEIPALEKLIESIRNEELSPKEALNQAEKIRDSKQNYH